MKILLLLIAVLLQGVAALRAEPIYTIEVKDIDGRPTSLAAYKGKVMLIVNVASQCGFTKQYKALEETYRKYVDQGFVVLGFPCNQFGGQEPGTNEEIKLFCESTYHVTFPLFDKIEVNGEGQHPLYAKLTGSESPFPGKITWNFNKFLIGRDGTILNRFESKATPDSPEVIKAIETALKSK